MTAFTSRMTLNEHAEAHWQCQKFGNRRMFFLRWLLIIPMSAGLIAGIFEVISGSPDQPFSLLSIIPMLMLLGLISWPYLIRRAIKRQLATAYAEAAITTVTVQLTDTGYRSELAFGDQYSFDWSDFDSFLERRSIFALVRGTKSFPSPDFVFFPILKKTLSLSQQQELHDFLTSNFVEFGKKAKRR